MPVGSAVFEPKKVKVELENDEEYGTQRKHASRETQRYVVIIVCLAVLLYLIVKVLLQKIFGLTLRQSSVFTDNFFSFCFFYIQIVVRT